jgi:hypothetical protein
MVNYEFFDLKKLMQSMPSNMRPHATLFAEYFEQLSGEKGASKTLMSFIPDKPAAKAAQQKNTEPAVMIPLSEVPKDLTKCDGCTERANPIPYEALVKNRGYGEPLPPIPPPYVTPVNEKFDLAFFINHLAPTKSVSLEKIKETLDEHGFEWDLVLNRDYTKKKFIEFIREKYEIANA